MITFEDELPAPAPSDEARTAAGDWPVCRPDMYDSVAIVERMGADALHTFDRFARIDEDALVRLGWRRDTVRRYGDRAREAFVRLLAARGRARRRAMRDAA